MKKEISVIKISLYGFENEPQLMFLTKLVVKKITVTKSKKIIIAYSKKSKHRGNFYFFSF